MKKGKTILYRLIFIAVLAAICAWMMVIGRGHTVYFDCKSIEWEGQTYDPAYKTVIFVNGEQAAKLYDGERGMSTWIGQNFKMDLEITQEKKGEEVTSSYSLKLPYNMDGVVINIPAFLAGLPEEAYISEFVSLTPEEDVEEEPVVDEFGIDAAATMEGDEAADAAATMEG